MSGKMYYVNCAHCAAGFVGYMLLSPTCSGPRLGPRVDPGLLGWLTLLPRRQTPCVQSVSVIYLLGRILPTPPPTPSPTLDSGVIDSKFVLLYGRPMSRHTLSEIVLDLGIDWVYYVFSLIAATPEPLPRKG